MNKIVDIIIPVCGAFNEFKRCVESVALNTNNYRIIIVNDASNFLMSRYLKFYSNNKNILLINNNVNIGYTKSINKGLLASDSDYICLLNSDTVVTKGWLDSMMCCINSDDSIGIVGPLSNAAGWQSIPYLRDKYGNFEINEIKNYFTIDDYASIIKLMSKKLYPNVEFANGFCFFMKRKVIELIGAFDELNFPQGYGEENDYCIRAKKAGFNIAIADDVFVYHEKSKSFGTKRRINLSRKASRILEKKYGDMYKYKINKMNNNNVLSGIRLKFKKYLDIYTNCHGGKSGVKLANALFFNEYYEYSLLEYKKLADIFGEHVFFANMEICKRKILQ